MVGRQETGKWQIWYQQNSETHPYVARKLRVLPRHLSWKGSVRSEALVHLILK